MAYPPKRNVQYEKVKIGELIPGVIQEIEYDNEHKFNYKGQESIGPAVRFKFRLESYSYLHGTRWMKFSVGEKANLYKQIISKLIKNARPDMCFDLDELKDMPVKTIWSENNDFQNLDNVYPLGDKKEVKETEPNTDSGEEEHEPQDPSWP